MTFLSIYTPTYRRPKLLAMCRASVVSQTEPVEHVIVPDYIGIGIIGMFEAIKTHAHKVHGDYVMVLSDDNVLLDDEIAEMMQEEATANDFPDVIVFKGYVDKVVQPAAWNQRPQISAIDLSCFAVKRDIWQRHSGDWGKRYEGDFDFINELWNARYRFHFWDHLVFKTLRVSHGLPENELYRPVYA